jgi:hypothetical protein
MALLKEITLQLYLTESGRHLALFDKADLDSGILLPRDFLEKLAHLFLTAARAAGEPSAAFSTEDAPRQ